MQLAQVLPRNPVRLARYLSQQAATQGAKDASDLRSPERPLGEQGQREPPPPPPSAAAAAGSQQLSPFGGITKAGRARHFELTNYAEVFAPKTDQEKQKVAKEFERRRREIERRLDTTETPSSAKSTAPVDSAARAASPEQRPPPPGVSTPWRVTLLQLPESERKFYRTDADGKLIYADPNLRPRPPRYSLFSKLKGYVIDGGFSLPRPEPLTGPWFWKVERMGPVPRLVYAGKLAGELRFLKGALFAMNVSFSSFMLGSAYEKAVALDSVLSGWDSLVTTLVPLTLLSFQTALAYYVNPYVGQLYYQPDNKRVYMVMINFVGIPRIRSIPLHELAGYNNRFAVNISSRFHFYYVEKSNFSDKDLLAKLTRPREGGDLVHYSVSWRDLFFPRQRGDIGDNKTSAEKKSK